MLVTENAASHEEIARAGSPAALVSVLRNGVDAARGFALWALSRAISPGCQATVLQSGGAEALIAVFSDPRVEMQEQAAAALAKLASGGGGENESKSQEVVCRHGGVKPLLHILDLSLASPSPPLHAQRRRAMPQAPTIAEVPLDVPAASSGAGSSVAASSEERPTKALLRNAVEALANLADEPTARDEIVTSGGVLMLVELLQSNAPGVNALAAEVLARLARGHEATQAAIADAGAIPPLISLLDGVSCLGDSSGGRWSRAVAALQVGQAKAGPAQEAAAEALCVLADHEANRSRIAAADGVGCLVRLLGCENARSRVHAEGVLVRLSIENANRKLIIEQVGMISHASPLLLLPFFFFSPYLSPPHSLSTSLYAQ